MKINMLKVIEQVLKFTSLPIVKKSVNLFCLNKERIKKKEVVSAIVSDILNYYKDKNIKKKIVAEECKLMQKYYFKDQIKKFSNKKKYKKVLNEYQKNLKALENCNSSEEIIKFLVTYYINDMAADFDPGFLIFFREMARWVFKNMFKSLKVTKKSKNAIERIKTIQGKYPLFIMPNHISNADHIPLCLALNKAGIFHPVIVAGANLYRGVSKKILPKANCYKLQREYIYGDVKWLSNPLYNMVFKKYNYYLWKHNEPFLFYIEGTRSRDGKILSPKYGFLKEIVKFIEENKTKAYFIPVSLSYTVVPEDLELVESLKGKNISQKDLLTQNLELDKIYGSVKDSTIYINIPEAIEISPETLPDVTELGKKIVNIISKNIIVTPTYYLATILNKLKKETFSLKEVEKHLSCIPFECPVTNFMEIAIDIFVKKKAIEPMGNNEYKLINDKLILQYANRIAHLI